jgi:hypothetical protein
MSWGIDFTADIFLSRQDYDGNVYRVQSDIDDIRANMQSIKERMLMMVMGGANSVNTKDCEKNDCDPVDVLHSRFCELLDYYNEQQSHLYDLLLYKEYLEKEQEGTKV